jgi:hypothetical protein
MTIERRIKALEQILDPEAPGLLQAVFMVGQTETGWAGAGHSLGRLPGETDADFKGRALRELGKIFPGPVEYCRALGEMLPG